MPASLALTILAFAAQPPGGTAVEPTPAPAHRPTRADVRPTAAPASVPPAQTASLTVEVQLKQGDGGLHPAQDAAVWLEGGAAAALSQRSPARPRIAQRNKKFDPHVEIVSVGTTVAFPNFDKVYHNVFSLSDVATFDLGLYRNGASRSVTFTKPGVVRIYCNIHPHMTAFLLVVRSEFCGKTGARGEATLSDVPPGRYDLKVWHETADEVSVPVTIAPGGAQAVRVLLDASRFRALPHKNKYGKDYPPPDDDENRY